jgi:hypothetical protein
MRSDFQRKHQGDEIGLDGHQNKVDHEDQNDKLDVLEGGDDLPHFQVQAHTGHTADHKNQKGQAGQCFNNLSHSSFFSLG